MNVCSSSSIGKSSSKVYLGHVRVESWNPIPSFFSLRYVNQNLHDWKTRLLSGNLSEDITYTDHSKVRFLGEEGIVKEGIPKKKITKCECYDLYEIHTHLSRFIKTHTQCFLCMKTNVVLMNECFRFYAMIDSHNHRIHCLDCNSCFYFTR